MMSAAETWVRNEIGAYYSQSFGNINVPEPSLSSLVSERDQLRAELERVKKQAVAMREALEELNSMLAMRGPGDNPYAVVRRALEHARTLNP